MYPGLQVCMHAERTIMATKRSLASLANFGARGLASSAAPGGRPGVMARVKKDRRGLFAVGASTMAFVLSAQGYRMRNERDEAVARAEFAERALAEYKAQAGLSGGETTAVGLASDAAAPTGSLQGGGDAASRPKFV